MFLKKFSLINEVGEVVREVKFKKGINIILGRSNEKGEGTSNSLGKTTLIRCIDFCLGAKNADELYKDSEFNISNTAVENFLKNNILTFSLIIAPRFNSVETIVIERTLNLNAKSKKITNKINGHQFGQDAFGLELKKIMFGFVEDRPKFRELIGKFIRKRDDQISHILRFNGNYSKISDYEKVHLILFGFQHPDLLAGKHEIEHKTHQVSSAIGVLEQRTSNSALEQTLYLLNSELEELIELRNSFQIDIAYEKEACALEKIQIELNTLEQCLAEIGLQKHVATERIMKLEQNAVSISSRTLSYLYEEANFYSEKLIHSFDELAAFHNTMLNNEIEYLQISLAKSDAKLVDLNNQREQLVNEYNETLSVLGNSGSLAEYTKLNDKIAIKSKEVGETGALLEELKQYKVQLEKLKESQRKLQISVKKQIVDLDEKLKIFNKFFSQYSERLDGEKYILYYEEKDNIYRFGIKGMRGNLGTGQKQAVVMAFDLAYMAFCNEIKLKRPLFATQDKIEVIDINKLITLFDLANEQNGQLIVPLIADKLTAEEYPKLIEDTVLTLTAEDRFFGIDD